MFKPAVALSLCIALISCGSGSGSDSTQQDTSLRDIQTIYPLEFTEDANGNVTSFSYTADITFDGADQFPSTLRFDLDFSKPVRRDGDRLVTLEPSTILTIRPDSRVLELAGEYKNLDIFVWNTSSEPYPGRYYDTQINPLAINYRNYPEKVISGPNVDNTNLGTDWFSWYKFSFFDLSGKRDPLRDDIEIFEAGVTFEPWRIELVDYTNEDQGVNFGVGFNLTSVYDENNRAPEVLDKNILIDYSPWYSFVKNPTFNECGSKYRFSADNTLSIEKNGAIGTGTYDFNSAGFIEWNTDAFGQESMIILDYSRALWEVRFVDDTEDFTDDVQESGISNAFGDAEFQLRPGLNGLTEDCNFQYD